MEKNEVVYAKMRVPEEEVERYLQVKDAAAKKLEEIYVKRKLHEAEARVRIAEKAVEVLPKIFAAIDQGDIREAVLLLESRFENETDTEKEDLYYEDFSGFGDPPNIENKIRFYESIYERDGAEKYKKFMIQQCCLYGSETPEVELNQAHEKLKRVREIIDNNPTSEAMKKLRLFGEFTGIQALQQRIFLKEFGIHWKTDMELNPDVIYE